MGAQARTQAIRDFSFPIYTKGTGKVIIARGGYVHDVFNGDGSANYPGTRYHPIIKPQSQSNKQ
jgi:hypothetical protein